MRNVTPLIVEVEISNSHSTPSTTTSSRAASREHLVRFNRVATNFFNMFNVPMLSGPRLDAG